MQRCFRRSFSIRLLAFGFIFILGCASSRLSTDNQQARQYFMEARNFEKASSFDLAQELYLKSLDADAEFLEAYLQLAGLYDRENLFFKSVKLYERAYQLAPGRTDILQLYAGALYQDRHYEDALLRAQELAEKLPESGDAQLLLGKCQEKNAFYEAAEATFLIARDLDPGNAETHSALGHYYYNQLLYSKAVDPFREAARRNGLASYEDRFHFGYSLMRTKNLDEAVIQLSHALEIVPGDEQVIHYKENAEQIAAGQLDFRAWQVYEESYESALDGPTLIIMMLEALELQPDYIDAHLRIAGAYKNEGLLDDALETYDLILSRDPDDYLTLNDKGLIYFDQGNYSASVEAYQKSLEINADQKAVKKNLELVQRISGGKLNKDAYLFYKKSLSHSISDSIVYYLKRAIEADSTYYEAYLRLGVNRMNKRFYVDATNAFIEGLKYAPDDETRSIFYFDLGLTNYYRDFHVKAIESFEKTIEYNPTDYDAYYYLSQTYLDYGDTKKATESYSKLLKLKPDYFSPAEEDYSDAGITVPPSPKGGPAREIWPVYSPGQVLKYRMTVHSENNALIGADTEGSFVRDVVVTFEQRIEEVDAIGNIEVEIAIISVEGNLLTAQEKALAGSSLSMRLSDIFGTITVFSLMETRPSDLMQTVSNAVEEMYTYALKKPVEIGESWTSKQNIVGLGALGSVSYLDRANGSLARVVSRYGITGSYDAAKYGGTGYVVVQNKGQAETVFDQKQKLVRNYQNQYEISTYTQSKAEWATQEASYSAALVESRQEPYVARKKMLIEGVPYVKQHGPQCAAASLSMVLQYFKNEIDQDSIYAAIKSDYAGAQSFDILNYPRSNGYKSYGYIGTLEDLKEKIDQKIPVILYFSPYGFGHVVVGIGYDEKKRRIIIHDPTIASDYEIPYSEFLKEWKESDFECTVVLPFDQDINISEGPITSHEAVETKWSGDKQFADHKYDEALASYNEAAGLYPEYLGALEGIVMVHLARNDFDAAEKALDRVITLDPNSVQGILRNAQVLMSRYDYDKVIELAKKAQALDESNIMNYIYLAQALQSQKKYEEAMEEIVKAVNLNPLTSFPRNILTSILVDMGEFDQAFDQARLSLKYEPENIGNHFTLSSVYTAQIDRLFLHGRKRRLNFVRALKETDFVKKVNPDLPNLDVIYADLLMNDYQYEKAEALYRKNIEKYPEENTAYNNLAWHFAERNINLEEAEKLSKKSIELSQNNPYYFDTLGWIHYKLGLYEKAAEELIETINYDKYSEFAYRHLGIVYAEMNKSDQADEQFDLVMKLVPDKTLAALEIADECERNNLDAYAMKFYRLGLASDPHNGFAASRLAFLLVRNNGDMDEAFKHAENAYSQDDSSFFYNGILGMVYFKKKELNKARTFLEKAVELQEGYNDPGRELNHYYLGLVYLELGKADLAKQQFKEYLKVAPNGSLVKEIQGRIDNLTLKD